MREAKGALLLITFMSNVANSSDGMGSVQSTY